MSLERTESQRASSRANGAKSQGPTSVMGKRISSRNSLKHGLLADVLLLPDESRDSLLELSTNMYDVFRPGNELEDLYVQRMVDAEWHLVRIRDYEAAALMVEISAQGPHPEIPIDDKVWRHPAARASAAFQNVHARGGSGSVIQTSKMRYLREFKEAQTQLFQLRENGTKWRIPANEPEQLVENERAPPPQNTEPEPDGIIASPAPAQIEQTGPEEILLKPAVAATPISVHPRSSAAKVLPSRLPQRPSLNQRCWFPAGRCSTTAG